MSAVSVLPVVGIVDDAAPFISTLPAASFQQRVVVLLIVLHDSLVRCAGYDGRIRVMLRRMCHLLQVRWTWFTLQESRYGAALRAAVDRKHGMNGEEESTSSRTLRYLKIGSAVVIGGLAIGLTAGLLAAPLLGAGLAGIGLTSAGASVGALVASSGGVVLVSSLFGIGPAHTADRHCSEATTPMLHA